MLKVLVWHVSSDTRFQNKALQILESQHNGIELTGITADAETSLAYAGKNIPFIPLVEVNTGSEEYEVLLVVGAREIGMSEATKIARQFKLPEEKLLGDWIVCIPGFTLDKYRRLQRSRLSILSVNCFGGFISNRLGLPFLSPIVNLYIGNQDFLKFMRDPHSYFEKTLTYYGDGIASDRKYPIAKLGDIILNMLHYKTFDESVEAWEKRKKRINWYNLFVTMWDIDEKRLEQFDALPYGKKACFVPFKSDLDSAWYINPEIDKRASRFVDVYNRFGGGNVIYYDWFDMLLYGKKTPLIEM